MLRIVIDSFETYDEKTNHFFKVEGGELLFEHSLLSLSEWEMKWLKPYLTEEKKTIEESKDYIRCMLLNRDKEYLLEYLGPKEYSMIDTYINSSHSASTIKHDPNKHGKQGNTRGQFISSELIYSWLAGLRIPFTPTETWPLDRVFKLVDMVNEQNQPKKKMGKAATAQRNAALNKARRAKTGSKG